MDATRRTRIDPPGVTVRLLSIALAVVLAGCASDAPTPTPDPSTASVSPSSPVAPTGPATSAPPSPVPTEPPSPGATQGPVAPSEPNGNGPRWEAIKIPAWFDGGQPVALADGRVLFVTQGSGKAAVWDPATGDWTRTDALNKWRSEFATFRLGDGRVLVAGGINDSHQSFSSAYTWDPRTGSWTKVGLLGQARSAPAMAALPDGRILAAGGYFAYTPDEGMTVPTIGGPAARTALAYPGAAPPAALAAFVPPRADVDVPPGGRALATVEIFDPRTGGWSRARPMRYARAGAEAVTLADGRVLVASSGDLNIEIDGAAYQTAELYDPVTDRWTVIDDIDRIPWRELREQGVPDWMAEISTGGDILAPGTLVALGDGNALLIGYSEWAKHQGEETRAFLVDVDGRAWREVGTPWLTGWTNEAPYREYRSPGVRRLGAAVVALSDGRVLVAGGYGGGVHFAGAATRAAQLYDPTGDTWTALPRMPEGWAAGPAVLLADGSALLGAQGGPFWRADSEAGSRRLLRFLP